VTLRPASTKTFAQIVPDQHDQEAISNEVSRIRGISLFTENHPEATQVTYASTNQGFFLNFVAGWGAKIPISIR
jgi:hypothetical protein